MRGLDWLLRMTLASVLATSGYFKAVDFAELEATLARSQLLLPGWEPSSGVALICAEIVTAALLLMPRTARSGLFAAAGLSSLFFGYSLWRIYQDISTPCGCFGFLFQLSSGQSILLTSALCAMALGCVKLREHSPIARSSSPPWGGAFL